MKINEKVFETINVTEYVEDIFDDIKELSMRCRFSNCTHTNEPDCAVKKAISEGVLSEERYNSYYQIKHEAQYVTKKKNKTKAIDYMKKLKLFHKF